MTREEILAKLDPIVQKIVIPQAARVDEERRFPDEAIAALGKAGLLGLTVAKDHGGLGGTMRDAALVVAELARACGSTAMVVCMHYAGAAVIEKFGSSDVRRDIAAGKHLSTLAFSEAGSRSHFWAPLSTAERVPGGVKLSAHKSFITSAGHATSYVWSSRPVEGSELSTLWLVPGNSAGLRPAGDFSGLGLRGNASAPIVADGVIIPEANRLGDDGKGFAVMMEVVLPLFNVLNAACAIGLCEAAVARTVAHVNDASLSHLSSKLVDLPTIRAQLARMRMQTDLTRALWLDTLSALEGGREDAMLRVLECKAAAGEAATEVLDLAMRICGGAAFRRDTGVERYFRDGRAMGVMGPTTDVLYDFIGKATAGLPLF